MNTCVSSPVTNRAHIFQNPEGGTCDCNTTNVVYLLFCNKCSLQYVGQTGRKLKTRITQHINAIRNGKRGGCPFLVKHFNSGPCCDESFSVNILEKLPGHGLTPRNRVDSTLVSPRKEKETEWILKLRTIFPYGQNLDIGKNLDTGDTIVGKLFPKLSTRGSRSGIHHPRRSRTTIALQDILKLINDQLSNNLRGAPNYFRTLLASLKKKQLKKLALSLKNCAGSHAFKQWITMALDIIDTQLYVPIPPKPKRKRPKFQLKLCFNNKSFDFINLAKILRDREVKEIVHRTDGFEEDDIPSIVFSLNEPIRSKIFNYSKFVSSLDIDLAFNNINSVPCHCPQYNPAHIDTFHKHIISGDLSIVKNSKLRNLLDKGPKFREPEKIDFDKTYADIVKALNEFIVTISLKKNMPPSTYHQWKDKVLEILQNKITNIKTRFVEKATPKILDDPQVIQCLDTLHEHFVLCPLDKAANNVGIVCKQLYAQLIIKELDLGNIDNPSMANTYERVSLDAATIVGQHRDFQHQFHLKVEDDILKLPPLHWTPKKHKTPTGSRFIIGSKKSSLKPIGKNLTRIFKVLFHHKRRYYRKAGFYSGLKYFWCIDNHQEVIDALDRISNKNRAKTISTFDFSTLYTKIPHSKLIEVLCEIVDSTFNDTNRRWISVRSKSACFVKTQRGTLYKYSKEDVKEALTYLINNAYFRIGTNIFRQKIGIPMGSDPAPFFANLFLFHFESKWVKHNAYHNYAKAKGIFNTFRYIDDLNTLNDNEQFSNYIDEIYPPELILNKENTSPLQATYLDLDITVESSKFVYKLYDKRNAYPFT